MLEAALQEIDETMYWMELLVDAGIMESARIQPVLNEADQLTPVIVTSVKQSRVVKSDPVHRSSFSVHP